MSARSAWRARWIASGSMSRPISRAMSASPGSTSASATKAGSSARVLDQRGQRRHQPVVARRRLAGADRGDVVDQQPRRDRLQRLPAVERIAVVRGEEGEVVGRQVGDELDRRREAAIDRQHRPLGDAGEDEASAPARVELDHAVARGLAVAASSGRSRPSCADEAEPQRNDHRLLVRLAGRRRHASACSRA